MKLNQQQLEGAVERFMAGTTDVAEERALFAAFAAGRRVPEHLEQYREMMQWYAAMSGERTVRRRLSPAVWLSAAAALALIVTVAVSYMGRMNALNREYMAYAGSYVIHNGVKNTNIAEILPQVKDVDAIIDRQRSMAEAQLQGIDMDDPQVSALVERVLGDGGDEDEFNEE